MQKMPREKFGYWLLVQSFKAVRLNLYRKNSTKNGYHAQKIWDGFGGKMSAKRWEVWDIVSIHFQKVTWNSDLRFDGQITDFDSKWNINQLQPTPNYH